MVRSRLICTDQDQSLLVQQEPMSRALQAQAVALLTGVTRADTHECLAEGPAEGRLQVATLFSVHCRLAASEIRHLHPCEFISRSCPIDIDTQVAPKFRQIW